MRTGRQAIAGVGLLVSCLLTSGCSPRAIVVTAVFLDDGQPVIVFQPCEGAGVTRVVLVEKATAPAATPTGPAPAPAARVWSFADVGGGHPVGRIRLLEGPPGWTPQAGGGQPPTGFAADRAYSVWVRTADDRSGRDLPVDFTLADLRALAADQVWANPRPYAPPAAMTRAEFGRHARASC